MRAANKACKECPFRRTSLKGWLGPWKSAREIREQAFSEAGLACHMQLHKSHEVGGAPVCTGALVCANKSAKLYRDEDLRKLAAQAVDDPDVMDAHEFEEYHKNRMKMVGENRDEKL